MILSILVYTFFLRMFNLMLSLVSEAYYPANSGAGAYIDWVLTYTSELIIYENVGIDMNMAIRNIGY